MGRAARQFQMPNTLQAYRTWPYANFGLSPSPARFRAQTPLIHICISYIPSSRFHTHPSVPVRFSTTRRFPHHPPDGGDAAATGRPAAALSGSRRWSARQPCAEPSARQIAPVSAGEFECKRRDRHKGETYRQRELVTDEGGSKCAESVAHRRERRQTRSLVFGATRCVRRVAARPRPPVVTIYSLCQRGTGSSRWQRRSATGPLGRITIFPFSVFTVVNFDPTGTCTHGIANIVSG